VAKQAGRVLPIGIALGQDSEVKVETGCTVVLDKVLNEYEDGRLDIITLGARRYRILQIAKGKPYLEARVEFIDDEEEPVDLVLLEKALEGFRHLLALVREESGMEVEVGVPETAFQIAQSAVLDLEAKQRLLEMTAENLRLQALCEHFDELVPVLEQRRDMRRRVRSNGHSKGS
jgi:Lon protease-like protein